MKFLRAMKKLKIKQQIIAAVMACVLGIGGIYSVHASVINDAKNKKNEAQQELDNLNSQIDEIQAAQSDLQEEMDAYDDQLMALLICNDLVLLFDRICILTCKTFCACKLGVKIIHRSAFFCDQSLQGRCLIFITDL